MSEIYLFVIWEKARSVERRILADIARHMRVKSVQEQSWPIPAAEGYARFYGAKASLAAGKVESCGGGAFVTVIVEDPKVRYGWRETSRGMEYVNLRTFLMKKRYRSWSEGGHCVHSTNSLKETRRDIFLLTGHTYDDWLASDNPGPWVGLPGQFGWRNSQEFEAACAAAGAVSQTGDAGCLTVESIADCRSVLCVRSSDGESGEVDVGGSVRQVRLALPEGYDTREARLARTLPADQLRTCSIDYVTDLRETLSQDWKWSLAFHRAFPELCFRPRNYHLDLHGEDYGVFARDRITGETLESAMDRGLSPQASAALARQMVVIADALEKTRICHREINPRTLIVDAGGRLRIRDFRFATGLKPKREPRWAERRWRVLAALNEGYRPAPWTWNDRYSFACCVEALPPFPEKDDVLAELKRGSARVMRRVVWRFNFRLRMWLYARNSAAKPTPLPDSRFNALVDALKAAVWNAGGSVDRLCLVGSAPLNAYGVRRCGDVDFLYDGGGAALGDIDRRLSPAEKDLGDYPYSKEELLYDPRRYFRYRGVKIMTLDVLEAFKRKRRHGAKDKRDILLVRALQAPNGYVRWLDFRYLCVRVKDWIYRREKIDGVRTFRILGLITFTRGKR